MIKNIMLAIGLLTANQAVGSSNLSGRAKHKTGLAPVFCLAGLEVGSGSIVRAERRRRETAAPRSGGDPEGARGAGPSNLSGRAIL